MSLDRSLKGANALIRHRNVLTRAERLLKLTEEERWDDSKSVYGLPKVAHRKQELAKAEKEADATAAAGAVPGATPAATPASASPLATYKVKSGDSPSKIAHALIHDGNRWPELIAANNSIEEIRQYIEADSLAYLSLDGLRNACDGGEGNKFCVACYTGDYPTQWVDVEDILDVIFRDFCIGK